MRSVSIVRPLAVTLLSATAHAEVPEIQKDLFALSLEELLNVRTVSAASGYQTRLREAPANAVVITRDDWKHTGARSVTDVLQQIPGVHVMTTWSALGEQVVVIRGVFSGLNTEVIWLLDGKPMTELPNNTQPWGWRFPLAGLRQIELIKGPGSAVHGADAMTGIINLVTASAGESAEPTLNLRIGAFDTWDLAWTQGGHWGGWQWQGSFEHQHSDDDPGRHIQQDLQSIIDAQLGTRASRAPGVLNKRYAVDNALFAMEKNGWRGSLWYWRSDETGLATGAAQALDPEGTTRTQMFRGRLEYKTALSESTTLDVDALWQTGKQIDDYTIFPAGAVLPVGADGNITFDPASIRGLPLFTDGVIGIPGSDSRRQQLQITSLTHLNETQTLRFAVGHERQAFRPSELKNFGPGVLQPGTSVVDGRLTNVTGTPYIYADIGHRTINYALAQFDWRLNEHWQITTGVRSDDYSDNTRSTNPRFSLQWRPSKVLQCRLQHGNAYRPPSFTEQSFKNNPVLLGNPDLRPEQLDSQEAGCRWFAHADLVFDTALFRFDVDNLIDYAPKAGGAAGLYAQNLRKKTGDGGEISLDWRPNAGWQLSFAWAQSDVRDEHAQRVPYAPRKLATLGSHWQIQDNWRASLFAKRIMDRPRAASDPRASLRDVTRVDVSLARQRIMGAADLVFSLQNATDADLRDPSDGVIAGDLPSPGRQWLLALDWSFR